MRVTCDIQHNTNARTCDLIVCYVDSSNYFYARFTFAAGSGGTIQIRKVVAGVDSLIDSVSSITLNTGNWYTVAACVSTGGVLSAYLSGTVKISYTIGTPTGTYCGLGCSGTGTALFDNFAFTKSYDATSAADCETCEPYCSFCSGGLAPDTVKVVISGAVGTCPDGTYYLPFVGAIPGFGYGPCTWLLTAAGGLDVGVRLWVSIVAGTTMVVKWESSSPFSTNIQWSNGSPGTSCTSWTDVSCAFVSDTVTDCDGSASTALVSAA
jgi:hypothetical protein